MYTLHKKSCMGMKEVATDSIDGIVTSPPYKDEDGYSEELMKDLARNCYRVLKNGSSCFVNFGQLASDKGRPFSVANEFAEYFDWIDTIIWVKSNEWMGGHYTPVNSKYRMNNMYEYIFQFAKGKAEIDRLALGIPYLDKTNIKRYGATDTKSGAKKDLRCAGNVWYVSYTTVQSKDQKPHKDMFPEEIPRRCLKLMNLPRGSTILDPFMGSGTTGRAARDMGYKVVGYEINDKYWTKEADLFE